MSSTTKCTDIVVFLHYFNENKRKMLPYDFYIDLQSKNVGNA